MTEELVSVIVPAFNAAPFLRRCVESILCQTHKRLELIVVNDCSTDATAGLLDSLAAQDPRLKVIHLESNVGIHAARAHGVRAALGDYLGFVDADDCIGPGMYAELVGEARRANADIAICGARIVLPDGKSAGTKVGFRRRLVFDDDLLGRFCRLEFGSGVLWNKLFRASVIRPFATRPLDRRVDASEDYIVNVGCFASAARVVAVPATHYTYFTGFASASSTGSNSLRFARVLRAYVTCLEVYADSLRPRFDQIDLLYARQLTLASYAVSPLSELAVCDAELRESLQRLAAIHPGGIYGLIHAFDTQVTQPNRGLKSAVREFSSSVKALVRAGRRNLRRLPAELRLHAAKS